MNIPSRRQRPRVETSPCRPLDRTPARTRWRGWALRGCILAGLAGVLLASVPVPAVEPAAKLTREERKQLERQALEFTQQAIQLYLSGRYAAATKLVKQSLEIN